MFVHTGLRGAGYVHWMVQSLRHQLWIFTRKSFGRDVKTTVVRFVGTSLWWYTLLDLPVNFFKSLSDDDQKIDDVKLSPVVFSFPVLHFKNSVCRYSVDETPLKPLS